MRNNDNENETSHRDSGSNDDGADGRGWRKRGARGRTRGGGLLSPPGRSVKQTGDGDTPSTDGQDWGVIMPGEGEE